MKKILPILALFLAGALCAQVANPAANVGQTVTFTVTVATGTPPFTYQWAMIPAGAPAGTQPAPIAGATAASYVVPNVQLTNAGTYFATVANSAGSVTGSTVLTVNAIPPAGPTVLGTVK